MTVAADLADISWPRHAEAIAVEYARLFAVPGEQAVWPYESVYCDTLRIDTSTACSPYFAFEPQPAGLTGFLNSHARGNEAPEVDYDITREGQWLRRSCGRCWLVRRRRASAGAVVQNHLKDDFVMDNMIFVIDNKGCAKHAVRQMPM